MKTVQRKKALPFVVKSPPSRRRGLKKYFLDYQCGADLSPPSRRRGLKNSKRIRLTESLESPPSRRRGLKILFYPTFVSLLLSPPSRRRGLKTNISEETLVGTIVASFAEAWIEKNTKGK